MDLYPFHFGQVGRAKLHGMGDLSFYFDRSLFRWFLRPGEGMEETGEGEYDKPGDISFSHTLKVGIIIVHHIFPLFRHN